MANVSALGWCTPRLKWNCSHVQHEALVWCLESELEALALNRRPDVRCVEDLSLCVTCPLGLSLKPDPLWSNYCQIQFQVANFQPHILSLRTLCQLHDKLARKIRLKSTFYVAACKGLRLSLNPKCRGLTGLGTCTGIIREVSFSDIQIKVSTTSPEYVTGCICVSVVFIRCITFLELYHISSA